MLQIYNPVNEWSEFRQLWIDSFHKKTYDRLWKHLTAHETEGDLVEFAQKKYEVFRSFFKTISDIEIIQLINVSMPKYIQSLLMSKMHSSFSAYIKSVKEEKEKFKEETEGEEESEEKEGNDENVEDQDETIDENAKKTAGADDFEEETGDLGYCLFK